MSSACPVKMARRGGQTGRVEVGQLACGTTNDGCSERGAAWQKVEPRVEPMKSLHVKCCAEECAWAWCTGRTEQNQGWVMGGGCEMRGETACAVARTWVS